MTEIVVKEIETEEAKEEIKNKVVEQEGTQNEEDKVKAEEEPKEAEEKPKEAQVKTKTDMNKLKQKNYSTRNQCNETVFCADCNKFMSKHNYRYNHLCQPLEGEETTKSNRQDRHRP